MEAGRLSDGWKENKNLPKKEKRKTPVYSASRWSGATIFSFAARN
jgi:hypothetical protein